MSNHKVTISVGRERRPWWRTWNDYANPTRDALLSLLGVAIIVILFFVIDIK